MSNQTIRILDADTLEITFSNGQSHRLREPLALEATPAEATPEKNYVGLCSLMAGEQEARKSD